VPIAAARRFPTRIIPAALIIVAIPLWTTGCATLAPSGKKPLTPDVLWGPKRVNFSGHVPWGLQWLPDGQHYLERRDDILQQIDALTGEAQPAYDYAALEAVLKANEDFDADAAERLARAPTLASKDYAAVVLEHKDRLYFYRFDEGELRRLTDEPAQRTELTLSPDTGHVAFIQDHNLYAIDTATGAQAQLTADGSETLLDGVLDWVYQEEIYGRGNWRSYWWSEDGSHIAYLQLDESNVPIYPLVDYLPIHPTTQPLRYPKAGDPNPVVRLGFVRADGGDTVWADLSAYEGTDILITRVSWAPDGRVTYGVQDRESRWLDLNDADPDTGTPRKLIHESSPAWIEYETPPTFLKDGSFLWLSERDGWAHLYHYTRDGQLIARLTAGEWEVRNVFGVDEEHGWVYFSGTKDSPVESHAYRVWLQGSEVRRLTEPGFSHHVDFDPHFTYFIDKYSNVRTPPKVAMRFSDGKRVRVISENEVPELNRYRLSPRQIMRIPTPRGYCLNAEIIRPPKSLLLKKHPVFVFVYGGPHMPSVSNSWGWDGHMFEQWLAQQGYLIWAVDPYSASGEGAVSAQHAYPRLGVTELQDLETSLHWLAEHENADLSRVGMVGHSYGGYMGCYALTHSKMFKMAIAGSALTDWRNYDSVYAERLMQLPDKNPEGYKQASAVDAAANLHGRLLLVHGVMDDNVHLTNVMQFINALQEANKQFDFMLYPTEGHGVGGPHWETLQNDFIKHNL
jgi:dipeptidyl-peptidase-4